MTKADQVRLTTWRFNVQKRAAAHPRSVAHTRLRRSLPSASARVRLPISPATVLVYS